MKWLLMVMGIAAAKADVPMTTIPWSETEPGKCYGIKPGGSPGFIDCGEAPQSLTAESPIFINQPTPGISYIGQVEHDWMTFGGGISVQPSTGKVRVPDGIALDEAAKRFWNAVAEVMHTDRPFPDLK